MISLTEYNRQKFNVEEFEQTVALAIARMKGIEPDGWSLAHDSKVSSSDETVTLTIPNRYIRVPWSDLQKFLNKGRWVVEFCDIYGNKEFRICETKKAATEEYQEIRSRTAKYAEDGDYNIEWVEKPAPYSWEQLAALDRGERCWC